MITQTIPSEVESASELGPVSSSPPVTPELEAQREKKRNKVRSAWISFVGRIVAQFVGASASIVLGMALLQKYNTAQAKPDGTPPAVATVAQHPHAAVRQRGWSGQPSLAVLPLAAFSADPRQKNLADAMTEALITALAQVDGLRVISRTSSMSYQGVQKPLPDIGRELGVDLILEGSVVRSGDRIRVTAQLIDAQTDEHVWARSYGRPARESLAFQDAMAAAIVRDMSLAMKDRERQVRTGSIAGIRYDPAVGQ
jgi:TolB-like protein